MNFYSLVNADLTGADLTGANFTEADLTGAKLKGVIAKEADFTKATGLNDEETLVLKAKGALFDNSSD